MCDLVSDMLLDQQFSIPTLKIEVLRGEEVIGNIKAPASFKRYEIKALHQLFLSKL